MLTWKSNFIYCKVDFINPVNSNTTEQLYDFDLIKQTFKICICLKY